MNDAETPDQPAGGSVGENLSREQLQDLAVEVLKTCYDPEIPVDIYELGLIYDVAVDESRFLHVTMTLTSPMCPVAGTLPGEVETKLNGIPGIAGATVELTWDPPWDPSRMSEAAKLELGF